MNDVGAHGSLPVNITYVNKEEKCYIHMYIRAHVLYRTLKALPLVALAQSHPLQPQGLSSYTDNAENPMGTSLGLAGLPQTV